MRFLFAAFVLVAIDLAPVSAATVSVVGGVQVIDGADRPAAAARARIRHRAAPAALTPPVERISSLADAVVRTALGYVGTPYVWGGASPRTGFDCSGFTQYVFRAAGVQIPRTADLQFAAGRKILGYPEPGDLVFFQTYEPGASHVGIYLGNGWFVQEVRPNVHLSNFNSSYFRSRYLGARRLLPS
ncbi:MAG: C40 family peptidase [Candidatus Eremiobacteraeota bacterium]|nr:C40 family peptidase [Candidatus Eremiobacteraeota bacterium]